MSAKDIFHEVVKSALRKEQWIITHDPLNFKYGNVSFQIDLGAEQLVAAERDGEKIAIEIKSFLNPSAITDFYAALGQFLSYRLALESVQPERTLYLAVPSDVYDTFFQYECTQNAVDRYRILLISNSFNCVRSYQGDNCEMDKVAQYREYVRTLMTRYADSDVSDDEVEVELILDTERDSYLWMNVGWQQLKRIYTSIVHIDIKDGKIWLQQNLTDRNPAEDLVEMGVPREDIVLGLQPPYKRPYTEYGMARSRI